MKEKVGREIDLADLFLDWLMHWKSLTVCALLGLFATVFCFVAMRYFNQSNASNPQTSVSDSHELSENELRSALSDQELLEADDLVLLYDKFLEMNAIYEEQKKSYSATERAETLYYLTQARQIIRIYYNALSESQRSYFLYHFGVKTFSSNDNTSFLLKIPMILLFVIPIVAHVLFFSLKFVFSDEIKRSDDFYELLNIHEFSRLVDWDKVNSMKGLDLLINRIIFKGVTQTNLSDVIKVNSNTVVDVMQSHMYNSVAIIGNGMDNERNMLKVQVEQIDSGLVVKYMDSITHSVSGAESISGVSSAILMVKVGCTKYRDFLRELRALEERNIDVLGVLVSEL